MCFLALGRSLRRMSCEYLGLWETHEARLDVNYIVKNRIRVSVHFRQSHLTRFTKSFGELSAQLIFPNSPVPSLNRRASFQAQGRSFPM